MLKRMLVGLALIGAIALTTLPASAMCQTGYIGFKNGRLVVEPPRCDPYP